MSISTDRATSTMTLVALFMTAGPACAAAPNPFDHAGLAHTVLTAHIRPGYSRLLAATTSLKKTLASSCKTQTAVAKRTRDKAFDDLINAWGRIEDIQFGPVTRETRLERILFWPDRRGRGARQVDKAIASRDQRVLDVNILATRSVALQGIGALERVLFSDPAAFTDNPSASFRCGYAQAIATNLQEISTQLQFEWSEKGDYTKLWLSAGPGNPQFLSPSETTLAIAKAFDQGIERVRDTRIAGPLALNAQRRRTPTILSTSGRTTRLITANIQGLRDLYVNSGMQSAITATNAGPSVNGNARLVANELTTALKIAVGLASVPNPFQHQQTSRRLIAMGFPLKNARDQTASLLALTAGLAMGFNASDGD